MDSVVAQLLARLSMFLYQELNFQIETQRFAEDKEYASQVLELVEEMDDHEFKMVAAQIRKRQLELFSLKDSGSQQAPAANTSPPETDPAHHAKRL